MGAFEAVLGHGETAAEIGEDGGGPQQSEACVSRWEKREDRAGSTGGKFFYVRSVQFCCTLKSVIAVDHDTIKILYSDKEQGC
jgi:hypothetical protein